jgi:hypothetical protein
MASRQKGKPKTSRPSRTSRRGGVRPSEAERREYWDRRGKEFGEEVSKAASSFAENVGSAFEQAFGGSREGRREWEKRMREKAKEKFDREFQVRSYSYTGHSLFGAFGPLFGSIIGLVFVAMGILALNLVNAPLQSAFLSALSGFVLAHLHWVFGIFLFFGYTDYLRRDFPESFWLVSPLFTAGGIVIMLWIAVWALSLVGVFGGSDFLMAASSVIWSNIVEVFVFLVLLGYVFAILGRIAKAGR